MYMGSQETANFLFIFMEYVVGVSAGRRVCVGKGVYMDKGIGLMFTPCYGCGIEGLIEAGLVW